MLLEVLARGGRELEGDELVAALLEAADDLANETWTRALGQSGARGRLQRGGEADRAGHRPAWRNESASVCATSTAI